MPASAESGLIPDAAARRDPPEPSTCLAIGSLHSSEVSETDRHLDRAGGSGGRRSAMRKFAMLTLFAMMVAIGSAALVPGFAPAAHAFPVDPHEPW